jgi:hydrogenase maturation protein HypF
MSVSISSTVVSPRVADAVRAGKNRTMAIAARDAERIEVRGVVQGVGFRPFVHRLATEAGLDGVVGNDSAGVFVEISGSAGRIDEFVERLLAEAPPLARIDDVSRRACLPAHHRGFRIVESTSTGSARTFIPPDTAVCDDCLDELDDPADRRYRHPFVTCTNCGPRFSIIRDLPYDRPATTMAPFAMCAACAAEYADPANRRYHAQPIGCHDCGPTLRYRRAGLERDVTADPLAATLATIGAAGTVAVKGVGGYQLACDATDDTAVGALRTRKQRPDKPFAVMLWNLDAAHRFAEISRAEAAQLCSPARPIVLLRARPTNSLSDLVAPDNPMLGIMLPSTPVHHLLFALGAPPLVMTSGNVSGEPLAHLDVDAFDRLGPLCDGFLFHDREIHEPCDDSVVRVAGEHLLPVRRARGFTPMPVPVGAARRSVLAVGGELKNTFCLVGAGQAVMSQHIGDMENLATLQAFERSVGRFEQIHAITPDVVAVDPHPGYATTRWARAHRGDRIVEVQHHHAHIAAVMAEHECDPHTPVIGVAFDGTGYGDDGTIWGGEVLVADVDGYRRVAHLVPVDLPGGDAAVRNPWRVALSHLRTAGVDWSDDLPPARHAGPGDLALLRRQLDRRVACVPTTSMGRLFDAVASLLDLRHEISYEAQASIQLEMIADDHGGEPGDEEGYRFELDGPAIDQRPVVRAIVDDLRAGMSAGRIAHRFHQAVADVVVEVARRERSNGDGDTVALSGGVFQNALLVTLCVAGLEHDGFTVLTPHLVPPNDGGLALGQAFVAAHRSELLLPRELDVGSSVTGPKPPSTNEEP